MLQIRQKSIPQSIMFLPDKNGVFYSILIYHFIGVRSEINEGVEIRQA